MAEAFLQVLLDNLASLIKGEIGLIMGLDNEMKKLSSTLTTIQAVLEDAEDKQLESKPIRNWLCKLNDLAYEINDVLDECATEVSKSQHKNSKLNRYSLKKILNRLKIGRHMKEVTEKLDAVAAEREKFHLREMMVERQSKVATTRETWSILNEPDRVYGRDEDNDKIVDILVNHVRDSQQLSVLPIVGIGGLGKTTLAQLVYNHPRVTEHFEKRLWVCVSDNFDIKTLVKAMIESATGSGSYSNLVHLDALVCRLRELLKQKRYLMILDDVWNGNQETWDKLKDILACGSRGASIIVTTRLRKVADIMGTLPTHHLSGLSEEHCWMLFRQRAFGQEMEEHPNLEAIGKEIVKKCGGVPLAAKALGGVLRFKRKENEWVYVQESEIWNLPQEEALILPALRLSYHHLPLQLRQCFAYCAVYPKDYEIEKEELIYCWMAHGYISSNGIMDVEDVGNEVWNELVLRSLFQDVHTQNKWVDEEGKYYLRTYFKMHDLVHDLAQTIMENKVPGAQMESSASNSSKIRQVNLRSHFVAFPKSIQLDMDMSYILRNFSRLRMLDASGTHMEDMPSAVGHLKYLRYLNLSDSKFHSLPNTVCSLWNLQILNLSWCHNLYIMENGGQGGDQVKAKFPSLEELRLSSLPNLKGLLKEEVGETFLKLQKLSISHCPALILPPLSSLKEFWARTCSNLNLNSFFKLGNLIYLKVRFDNDMTTCIPKETLENLSNLEKLDIANVDEKCLPIEGLQGLKSLKELHIQYCDTLTCLPDGWLRHLTTLEKLHISKCDELVELPEEIKYIHSLKHLILSALPKMVCLPEVLQHVPSLQSLTLNSLYQLTALPDWLGNFTSLELLILNNCTRLTSLPASIQGMTNLRRLLVYGNVHPELQRRCEKQEGEDWHKIAHIPTLYITP
ncbi:hypothetical protein BUALT_Bualt05G0037100 [Buddleja alternifolia]|uniref:Disease resistance protein RGA3 n=1 Tax=Buddleja alternifolia TaxID=168488 RepID=A0AAV6XHU0_9LAMI|nr:hypothetical protein BUALT_Bualt05G0037100 [Buddleja alternifolia]